MPRLARGLGPVAHELDNGLLLRSEVSIEFNALIHFFFELLRANLGGRRRAKLIAALERERLDAIPMGGQEAESDLSALPIFKRDWLPAVGVHARGWTGRVHRFVTGPIGIRLAVGAHFIAELVGAIVMPVSEERLRRSL